MMSILLIGLSVALLGHPAEGFLKIGRKRSETRGIINVREVQTELQNEFAKITRGLNKVQGILRDVYALQDVAQILDLTKRTRVAREMEEDEEIKTINKKVNL